MTYPSLTKLRSFAAIAAHRSFRKASAQMNLSQPALSAHIRDLEEGFGCPLFHRTTRSVRLTAEGERFLGRVRQALSEIDTGLMELRDHVALRRGRVVVACLPTFANHILPKAIAVFARKHPLIRIQVYDEIQSALVRRVQNLEADFGIGALPDAIDSLSFAPIFSDPLVAVLPKDHRLAARSTLDLKTLAKEPLITLSANANIRTVVDRAFAGIGAVPNFAFEAFDRHTVCGMVEAGLGAAILPRLVLSTIGNNALRVVRPIRPNVAREFGVIERRDQAQSPAVRSFLAGLLSTLGRVNQKIGVC